MSLALADMSVRMLLRGMSEIFPSQEKRLTQTESEGLETNFPSKRTGKKKAGVAILISDKIDFQRRAIKRDPEGHFIILKGRIHQKT